MERLAQRLGVGSRQLTRLFARHLQASPSKVECSYTYAICDPPYLPLENYMSTIRVTPVTDAAKAFVEWTATFDCEQSERDRWVSFFEKEGFAKWLGGLRRYMSDAS